MSHCPDATRGTVHLLALTFGCCVGAVLAADDASIASTLLARVVEPPLSTEAAARRWVEGRDLAQVPLQAELEAIERQRAAQKAQLAGQVDRNREKGPPSTTMAARDTGLVEAVRERIALTLLWSRERAQFQESRKVLAKQREDSLNQRPEDEMGIDLARAGAVADTTRQEAIRLTDEHLDQAPPPGPLERLTPRKREILQLLAEGHSTKKIGLILGISPKTVETLRTRMMQQLGIRDLAGLVRFAIRHGLISPEG